MLGSISFNQSHQSSLSHNNRENIYGNPGIDPARLHENIYFVQKDIRSVYKDVFQEAVDKYNEKQKRNDRKIDDYYNKVHKDDKTHEQRELVVAIGEGKDDPKYRKAKKEALKRYAEAFQERNPNLAVYNMVLHDDEANPHLHINYVPNFESSRGLTRRVGMDRALQQQGVQGKGTELIANWRQLETAYIESLAKEQIPNFERANVGSHKYMKVRQYKEYAEAKSTIDDHLKNVEEKTNELEVTKTSLESDVVDTYKELEIVKQEVESENEKLQLIGQRHIELEKRVEQMQKELDSAIDLVPNELVKIPFLRKEVVVEVQDKMFGKAEIMQKQTRNYVLSPEQYQELTKQVNAAVTIKKDYERLKKADFVKENESLKVHAEGWMKENRRLKQEKSQLQKEVGVLNREISLLKVHIKDLQANIRVLYQQTKKVFKEKFKAFRGLIKENLDRKGINNYFENEYKKEINKHRGFDMEQ
ncbi:plasmid recombination protein [Bacillus toyonensis]|uniref:plasmid recombination protein n=1 Tax=Bacillus toyonensis TaxID=155322 RepID=UPI000CD87485|nr:plasmid recombination protein [Bacillus toyonensis]MED3542179.1 plasmid recombination protein [Bacillus toyonensis]MEE2020400.1 plasmid recombination protein [Bacillus toyonensis]